MGHRARAHLFRTPTKYSFRTIRFTRCEAKTSTIEKDVKPAPKSHLNSYVASPRGFLGAAWVKYLNDSDFKMMDVEAKSWESIHQRPSKQAAEIPTSVLKVWGNMVSDSKSDISGRLFARSFRAAVAVGLRWDDLLNAAPTTLVLLREPLIGFAAKTKTRGKSEGSHRCATNFAFPNEEWAAAGFHRFKENPGGHPPEISG